MSLGLFARGKGWIFFLKGRCVLFAFDVRRFEISEIRYCIIATLMRFPNIYGWIWGLKSVALFALYGSVRICPVSFPFRARKKNCLYKGRGQREGEEEEEAISLSPSFAAQRISASPSASCTRSPGRPSFECLQPPPTFLKLEKPIGLPGLP